MNLLPKCTHTFRGYLKKQEARVISFLPYFHFSQGELPVSLIGKVKDATNIPGNRVNINLFLTALGISDLS